MSSHEHNKFVELMQMDEKYRVEEKEKTNKKLRENDEYEVVKLY